MSIYSNKFMNIFSFIRFKNIIVLINIYYFNILYLSKYIHWIVNMKYLELKYSGDFWNHKS